MIQTAFGALVDRCAACMRLSAVDLISDAICLFAEEYFDESVQYVGPEVP